MVTASSALAATLPQKHLGTVLRPSVWADLWLPYGAKPMWLAIQAIQSLQSHWCWHTARRPIRSGGSMPNPVPGSPAVANRYAKHLSTENGSWFLSR